MSASCRSNRHDCDSIDYRHRRSYDTNSRWRQSARLLRVLLHLLLGILVGPVS